MKLRSAMLLVALCGFVAAAAGVGVRATYGARTSADEPQYLLTALSLGQDRNLDISDEIAGERYRAFHEVTLDRQTEPRSDGTEVSPHDPLLPVLLALPMEVAGWVGAKLTLALLNGVLGGLLVWVAVRRFGIATRPAAIVIALFVASAPLAVYGNQVYPEVPAALAVTVGIAVLAGDLGRRGLIALGVAIVTLPWLSVKYAPVAFVMAVAALWLLSKSRRFPALAGFAGSLAAAGIVYVIAHLEWYGGLTVYAAGDHFVPTGEFGVIGNNVDIVGRSRRLIGLLVDDRFGLALWQPAFVLVPVAAGASSKQRDARWGIVAAIALVGWLNATFVALTMQGWWWPGRQVVIVAPALVLMVAWWAAGSMARLRVALALGAVGVLSYAWIVVEGYLGRLTWIVDFFETTSPFFRLGTRVTPDYLDVTATTWVLHAAWILVVAALFALGRRSGRGRRSGTAAGTAAAPTPGAASALGPFELPDPRAVVVPAGSPEEGRRS